MKRKQITIIPASILLIVFFLCATILIQPTDAKDAIIPVIVITQNAMTALVNAGNGNLTFYETIERIIQDGGLVTKSIVPSYFPTSLASNFSAISPNFNSASILALNLSTVSKYGNLFFAQNGADYASASYTNDTLLIAPTKTIEINSLGVNLQITYNSTQEPIDISNQYSQLFGIIAIIDASSTAPPTSIPTISPTASPTVPPELPIIICVPLLALALILIIAYLRKNRINTKV